MPSSIPDRLALRRCRLIAIVFGAALAPGALAAQSAAPVAAVASPSCVVTVAPDSAVGDRVGGSLRGGIQTTVSESAFQ